MSTYYSHSYEDPESGEVIDVMEAIDDDDDDDDDAEDVRNARPRGRGRGRGRRRPGRRPRRSRRPGRAMYPRPPVYQPPPRPPQPAQPSPGAIAVRPSKPVVVSGDHLSVRKSALIEFIPAVGKLWASFLGKPNKPIATGDNITDHNNASEHREALADHAQNQTRILALSDLAAKAVKMFTE